MGSHDRVPTAEGVTYVEFKLTNSTYPFVGASTDGGQVVLEEIIPRGDKGYGEFYSIYGVAHNEIMRRADAHGSVDAQRLADHDDGALYEFVVGDHCPAVFLGEQGALPREIESIDGNGRIAAEIPPEANAPTVVNRFLETHPDAELVAKRQQPYRTPMFSSREFQHAMEEQLTDRQHDVLMAAHEGGYYDWPRDTSGEDLAARFDISPSTFHQHLRAAEQTLIAMVFERAQTAESPPDATDP